jgi:hypothetical protein
MNARYLAVFAPLGEPLHVRFDARAPCCYGEVFNEVTQRQHRFTVFWVDFRKQPLRVERQDPSVRSL